MTALGLAVAIPAVLSYNALVRGNKGVLTKLNRFAYDLHALFLTGARVDSSGRSNAQPDTPKSADHLTSEFPCSGFVKFEICN